MPETTHTAEYERLERSAGRLLAPGASLIEFRGADCLSWLQGQATNDLRGLEIGDTTRFCLTEATGQLVAICSIWRLADRVLVSTDTACKVAVLNRVRQMVILEDVQADDLDRRLNLASVQGPEAAAQLSKALALPSSNGGPIRFGNAEGFALRSDRTGRGGWDVWLPPEEVQTLSLDLAPIDDDTLELARLEVGIPRFSIDTTSKTLPPELGPAFVRSHISYTKGCYVGQEVLMRIHSRGHTNKTWVGLRLDRPSRRGAEVADGDGNVVGVVTTSHFSPRFGEIAAATVRNECAAPGTGVVVMGDDSRAEAEVCELPFLNAD